MSQRDRPGLFGGKKTQRLKAGEVDSLKEAGDGTQEAFVEESHIIDPW